MSQLSLQDFYTQLDPTDRAYAQEQAEDIKAIANNATIQIGQKLIKVKERLGHGKFGEWIKLEFEWGETQAKRLMAIASELSNRHHGVDLPQSIKPAYALASALTKEDEQGKEELLNGYQEKLEEKQQATPEGKTPPTSLTEKEIKELIKERDSLKDSLESSDKQLKQARSEIYKKQLTLDQLQEEMDEEINNAVAKEVKQVEKQLQQEVNDLQAELERKEETFTTTKAKLQKEIESFKANPDPDTQAKIDQLQNEFKQIQSQVNEANRRLQEARDQQEERHAKVLVATGFFKMIDDSFKTYPRISSVIASLHIDEGHEERFKEIRDSFYHYGDLIDKALASKQGANDHPITVDVESV